MDCEAYDQKPQSHLEQVMIFPKFLPFSLIASYKKDLNLEKKPNCSAQACLDTFISNGGTFLSFDHFPRKEEPRFTLYPDDAIYPICPGGLARSQALWAFFLPFKNKIVLFPPHAAIYGWDPYDGEFHPICPCHLNFSNDQFSSYFKVEKPKYFASEMFTTWEKIKKAFEASSLMNFLKTKNPSEDISQITKYYDEHYFGPNSSYKEQTGKRRIYITFAQSTHVILYRLIQSNPSLKDVVLIHIDLEDIVANPCGSLNIIPRSQAAYAQLEKILEDIFDISRLKN